MQIPPFISNLATFTVPHAITGLAATITLVKGIAVTINLHHVENKIKNVVSTIFSTLTVVALGEGLAILAKKFVELVGTELQLPVADVRLKAAAWALQALFLRAFVPFVTETIDTMFFAGVTVNPPNFSILNLL